MNEMNSGAKVAAKSNVGLVEAISRWAGLHRSEIVTLILVLSIVWIAALTAISFFKKGYDQRIENQLVILLESADQSIHVWSHDRKAVVENLAVDEDLIAATQSLLLRSTDKQSLLKAPEQELLRRMFISFLKGGNLRGFFIIDQNKGKEHRHEE